MMMIPTSWVYHCSSVWNYIIRICKNNIVGKRVSKDYNAIQTGNHCRSHKLAYVVNSHLIHTKVIHRVMQK